MLKKATNFFSFFSKNNFLFLLPIIWNIEKIYFRGGPKLGKGDGLYGVEFIWPKRPLAKYWELGAILTWPPRRLPQKWIISKIDFFDVSDDLKTSRSCPAGLGMSRNCPAGLGTSRNCPAGLGTSRNCPAGLGNVQKLPRRVRNVKKLPRRVRPSS